MPTSDSLWKTQEEGTSDGSRSCEGLGNGKTGVRETDCHCILFRNLNLMPCEYIIHVELKFYF